MSTKWRFSQATKLLLEQESSSICAIPTCNKRTRAGSINHGQAAHIYSGALNGPRHNPNMSDEQLSSPSNGIWLCQHCHKTIDTPSMIQAYPANTLHSYKAHSAQAAIDALTQPIFSAPNEYTSGITFIRDYDQGLAALNDGVTPSFPEGAYGFLGARPDLDPATMSVIHKLTSPTYQLPSFSNHIANEAASNIIQLFREAKYRIDTQYDINNSFGTEYVDEREVIMRSINDFLNIIKRYLHSIAPR